MKEEKVFAMSVARVYPLLVAKAERKGRTRAEVDEATCWLTGYTKEGMEAQLASGVSYRTFFEEAPGLNPAWERVMGSICGVRIEGIEHPLMRKIRVLDKLVDELAKGKPMDRVLRKE